MGNKHPHHQAKPVHLGGEFLLEIDRPPHHAVVLEGREPLIGDKL